MYISGLDGDYLRKPFGQILQCIPLCDKVDKLTGLDMMSKDGSIGLFTKRIVNSSKDIFIADKPYPSWALDSNDDWQAPTDKPDDGKLYYWNETDKKWEEVTNG